MAVQSFSFNPFALPSVESAWRSGASSPVTRLYKSVTGAIYDLSVKNPYDLTIGNLKTLATAPGFSLRTKVAVVAAAFFGSLCTLMLYGTTFHLLGRGFLACGDKTEVAALTKVGEVVKELGTKLFLGGAVPVYGLFYALPKHIIASLPEIVRSVALKISTVAKWVFQNIIQPFCNAIDFVVTKIAMIIKPIVESIARAMKSIARLIVNVANQIFHYVLSPLWNKILLPGLLKIGNAIEFIATTIRSALKTLVFKIAHMAEWIFSHIIEPIWNHGILPLLRGVVRLIENIGQGIVAVIQRVEQAAQWVFRQLIVPIWNGLVFPILKAAGNVIHFVAETLRSLADTTAKAASFIFQNIIAPVFRGITTLISGAGRILLNYVIEPLGTMLVSVATKVGQVFRALFNALVVPVARAVYDTADVLKRSVSELTTEIWRIFTAPLGIAARSS